VIGHGTSSYRTWTWLVTVLAVLFLVFSTAAVALAGETAVRFGITKDGRFTQAIGLGIARGEFVAFADADVILSDVYLIGVNGTQLQQITQPFGAILKVPTEGYTDTVTIKMDGVYVARAPNGAYAKLCLCGTYIMGMSAGSTYEEYRVSYAVTAPASASTPDSGSTATPVAPAQTGQLTATSDGATVALTWSGFGTTNDGFYVFRREEGGTYDTPSTDFSVSGTSYSDSRVAVGKTYYYAVKGYKDGTYTTSSNEAAVTVKAAAAATRRVVKLQVNNDQASVNGQAVKLDVPPQLIEDRTMVPLRFVAEALGAKLDWDGTAKRITFTSGGRKVILWVGKKAAEVDGAESALDVAPTIVADRTMVPLRFVSERMGAKLLWNAADKTIELTSGGDAGAAPVPEPAPAPEPKTEEPQAVPDLSKNPFIGFYVGVRVPGVAYVNDFAWSSVLTISPGVMTRGTLLISADGTYAWNSSWDDRLIEGKWQIGSEGLVLIKAQEGKNWTVSSSSASAGGGDILIWDGSTWYVADRQR